MESSRFLLMLLAAASVLVVIRACDYQQRDDHHRHHAQRAEVTHAPVELPPVPTPPPVPEVELPSFTVVGEDMYDGPDEARVKQTIVVDSGMEGPRLRALLLERYTEVVTEAAFSSFKAPTDVTITVYDSREAAVRGGDDWRARLQMVNRQHPKIEVRN